MPVNPPESEAGQPARESPSIDGAELAQAREEVQKLQREIEALRERISEREREIGKELHDGICQEMTAVGVYIQCLENLVKRENCEKIPELIQRLSESADKAVRAAHALSRRLLK